MCVLYLSLKVNKFNKLLYFLQTQYFCIGNNVEVLDSHPSAGGNVNWYNPLGQATVTTKTGTDSAAAPPLLPLPLWERGQRMPRYMYRTVLSCPVLVTKTGKQYTCRLTGEWINNAVLPYTEFNEKLKQHTTIWTIIINTEEHSQNDSQRVPKQKTRD